MSLALSICVLLISLIQLVNGAQFLNITFLLALFTAAAAAAAATAAAAAAVLLTVIVPLTRIYASL